MVVLGGANEAENIVVVRIHGVHLILLIVGVVGYLGISKIDSHLEEISGNRLPSIYSLEIIKEAQTAIKAANRTMLIPSDSIEQLNHERDNVQKAFEKVDKAWKVYDLLPQTKEEEVLWKKFVPQWEAWKKDALKVGEMTTEFHKTNSQDAYNQMVQFNLTTLSTKFKAAEETLNKIIELNDRVAQEEKVESLQAQQLQNLVGQFRIS